MEKKVCMNKTHRKAQNRIEKKIDFLAEIFPNIFLKKTIDISKKGSIILI